MIKLLIADDEPLVQIGLRSMINWASLGIEICAVVSNGEAAWESIRQMEPEIVITDIEMPCMSGLELGRRCTQLAGRLPVFIILTSHEDFQYAREALSFHAVEYLVKLDLTPETLTAAVEKAVEQVSMLIEKHSDHQDNGQSLLLFQQRFYFRLINHMFETPEQLQKQMQEAKINLSADAYIAASLRLTKSDHKNTDSLREIPLHIYDQTLRMMQELLAKYIPCRIIPLDAHSIAVIFLLNHAHDTQELRKENMRRALTGTADMLDNYYGVSYFAGIGSPVDRLMNIHISYSDARQLTPLLSSEHPILFFEEHSNAGALRNVFNMSLFRDDIRRAFQELDETSLCATMDTIISLFTKEQVQLTQALDAAAGILHFAVTLLPDGADVVASIFCENPETYHCLYHLRHVSSVVSYMTTLKKGLCDAFARKKSSHQNALCTLCTQYIREHIHEKILLQDIADTFSVSPNYLSGLFKKHMNIGINEYVTSQKIDESKKLLRETTLKIYEISDLLGFETSFYFSKVFKKMTGCSPKDFRNRP